MTASPQATGRRRRAGAAVLAVAAALVLAACQGLPSSSPVSQGQVIGRAQPEGVRIIPRGPVPGSSPADLVQDFLRAGVGAAEDSGVAREYLTQQGTAQWSPDGSAYVYDAPADLHVSATPAGVVTVTARVSAVLDKEGHYVELPPGQVRRTTLTLARVGGEWRIDGGLQQLTASLMSRGDLGRYVSYAVSYAAPDGTLVSDRRWFLQGSGLLTRLTRAQLAAPPAYLQGAVTTGVPEYTDLALGAVTVDNGVAHVQLTRRALDADDRSRQLMWRQLVGTLTAVGAVDSVQLEADGSRLTAPGLPDRPLGPTDVDLSSDETPTTSVLLRSSKGLERVDPLVLSDVDDRRSGRDLVGPALPDVSPRWFRLAVSPDGHDLAAISGDRSRLARWRDGRPVAVPVLGDDLTRPSYGADGSLWVGVSTPAGPRVAVIDGSDLSGHPPRTLDATWLAGRTIEAVRPAADGQRVLVVSTDAHGAGATVSVAGVVRKDGRPVGLAAPMSVAGSLTDVTDATWLDDESLGVVGRTAAGADQHVLVAPLGGPSQVLGAVPGATGITSYGGQRAVVVTTRRGVALVRSGNGFVPLVSTSDVVVPGH